MKKSSSKGYISIIYLTFWEKANLEGWRSLFCLPGIGGEGASDSKGRFRGWTLTMVVTGIYVCVKLIALYTEKKMNSTVCQFKTIYIE